MAMRARSWVQKLQYQTLQDERYECTAHLGKLAFSAGFDQLISLFLRMNHWLALKELGRLNECRREIEDFDLSATQPTFIMARMILLGNEDEAISALEKLVDQEVISRAELEEWPLLRSMRNDGKINHLLKRPVSPGRTETVIEIPEPEL